MVILFAMTTFVVHFVPVVSLAILYCCACSLCYCCVCLPYSNYFSVYYCDIRFVQAPDAHAKAWETLKVSMLIIFSSSCGHVNLVLKVNILSVKISGFLMHFDTWRIWRPWNIWDDTGCKICS